MTHEVLTRDGDVLPIEEPMTERYRVGLPAADETVCATDPFDDFDEEWDDELPGEDDLPDGGVKEANDAPFDDDAEFDE